MDRRMFSLAAATAVSTVAMCITRARSRHGRPLGLSSVSTALAAHPKLAKGLVAHRGWHYPSDDLTRPLENTLPAYERAWSAGVPFCECDVTLTKDGEIILCHDNDLKRLALDPSSIIKPVSECNFRDELEYFPLKDGSRVPTLREVLQAAKRVGRGRQLVIEIKGRDEPCARRVSELVRTLSDQVALVMGFSVESVVEFARSNPKRGSVLSMLLTVRRKGSNNQYFDLNEMEVVVKLIKSNNIDGLYLQFDKEYLTDDRFIQLCQQIPIGVWGRNVLDPDDLNTVETLLARGARFVNTDFPDNFFG